MAEMSPEAWAWLQGGGERFAEIVTYLEAVKTEHEGLLGMIKALHRALKGLYSFASLVGPQFPEEVKADIIEAIKAGRDAIGDIHP